MWAWLLGAVTTLLSSTVARWIAFKVVISAIVMVTLPIILNNIIYKVVDISANIAESHSSTVSSWVGSFAGLTAWILSQVRAPEVLAIIMSAIAVRYALGLVPFVRL